MCTAASYRTKDLYFGRNLDYEFSYGDEVTITPRNYPFTFRRAGEMRTHYAMIGMAYVAEEYPLYYDAVNEKGLCIAGLNFVGNAACQSETDGKDNISVFELIPWLLGQCADLNEVRALLAKLNLVDIPFNAQLPTAKLHWLITDRTGSITVEAVLGIAGMKGECAECPHRNALGDRLHLIIYGVDVVIGVDIYILGFAAFRE